MQSLVFSPILQSPKIHSSSNDVVAKAPSPIIGSTEFRKTQLLNVNQQTNLQSHTMISSIEVTTNFDQAPAPETIPSQKITDFTLVSLGLLVVFWVGNYVVPDLIFSKLFKQEQIEDQEEVASEKKSRIADELLGIQDTPSQDILSSSNATRSKGFGQKSLKRQKN